MSKKLTDKKLEGIERKLEPAEDVEVVVIWDEQQEQEVTAAARARGDVIIRLTWGDDDEIYTEVIEPRSEAPNL